jgi:hypothetical protein
MIGRPGVLAGLVGSGPAPPFCGAVVLVVRVFSLLLQLPVLRCPTEAFFALVPVRCRRIRRVIWPLLRPPGGPRGVDTEGQTPARAVTRAEQYPGLSLDTLPG